MEKKEYIVNMTKDDMLRYYENKIVEDGIRECSEFNIAVYLTDYGDGIDLRKYKNEIMQLLCKDERIADVMIDEEFRIDMVFWTSYCPYYYDEVEDITPKEESKLVDDFYYFAMSQLFASAYESIRVLINNYVDTKIGYDDSRVAKLDEKREKTYNILKENIVKSGFIDKYIENNNETFLTLQNKNEFEKLIKDRINKLENQIENQEEEEFE